ncbi:tRNA (guanine(46)-N(7))-methyltransferase TrmB [Lichenihabitans sp. PAMC28606]|uniref:tRNA (guanine(46)-N(7))-methyltransferase TrmB n=1 Tax=Lichenihabitans sp. PAMC28606 TaxID=2880932 RepID=UPI001D0B895F|nr:tRNA (guanine(46)-N(7))-methyltransferase TrmB [Lichenihabitans sp. PAMC28606]UDL95853.1 tRNA (guanine(46)-N(7))-methyltransferase TrmB [Lichenihabitans sp. PAMC28606]
MTTENETEPQALSGFRSGILHGRRQGRRLRETQSSLMEHLLPRYLIDRAGPLDQGKLFGHPVDAVRLEIGFGGGEHLAAQASQNPTIGYIGCEPFRNGIARLLQQLDGEPWPNLRLYDGDAGEIIDRLDTASLAGVDLLYPDPWPKRRQRKRRFISAAMLTRLARVMTSGSELHFATDIDDYAGWAIERIDASPDFAWRPVSADDWLKPWHSWVETRYEAKAKREGRKPAYLTFVRL